MKATRIIKKIGIFVKADRKAGRKADELEKWLNTQGVSVIRKENRPFDLAHRNNNKSLAPSDLFGVFVLGGDGTFLSAVRWIGDQNIPILGIKFGDIGFLAETSEESLIPAAESVLRNEFSTETRMRLVVRVVRDEKDRACETVLNDVVINRGALARLANIDTYIDEHYLTTYRADGLIVASPTGSTAYSVAAGGPIIHPAVPGIIMSPICPFTLTNRPLIIPDTAGITIRLEEKSSDIMLTFDGQEGLEIDERDIIMIKKGKYPVTMIKLPGQNYYDILKSKLNWSGGRA
jgi:NAD+ kinase